MDENSHEPCDPTVADVGYRKSNVANQLPSYDTHNAVCFAWPATTLAARHDASRLMVERYRPGNRVSSEEADRNSVTPGQTEMQMD